MTAPKYPNITVNLGDVDGNIFAILGTVKRAMRRAGVPAFVIGVFLTEAKAADYDHAIQTVMRWVDVDYGATVEEDEDE